MYSVLHTCNVMYMHMNAGLDVWLKRLTHLLYWGDLLELSRATRLQECGDEALKQNGEVGLL